MEPDMSHHLILKEKRNILLKALEETDIDIKNIEECLSCLANNEDHFEELKKLQIRLSLSKVEGTKEENHLNDEILSLLLKLSEKAALIQETIKTERGSAAAALSDFTQIKSVANSYVKVNQGPVFVNKDFK